MHTCTATADPSDRASSASASGRDSATAHWRRRTPLSGTGPWPATPWADSAAVPASWLVRLRGAGVRCAVQRGTAPLVPRSCLAANLVNATTADRASSSLVRRPRTPAPGSRLDLKARGSRVAHVHAVPPWNRAPAPWNLRLRRLTSRVHGVRGSPLGTFGCARSTWTMRHVRGK